MSWGMWYFSWFVHWRLDSLWYKLNIVLLFRWLLDFTGRKCYQHLLTLDVTLNRLSDFSRRLCICLHTDSLIFAFFYLVTIRCYETSSYLSWTLSKRFLEFRACLWSFDIQSNHSFYCFMLESCGITFDIEKFVIVQFRPQYCFFLAPTHSLCKLWVIVVFLVTFSSCRVGAIIAHQVIVFVLDLLKLLKHPIVDNVFETSCFVQRLVYSFCLECTFAIALKFLLTLWVHSQQLIPQKWGLERFHICFVQELIKWIPRWWWSWQIPIFFLFVGEQVIRRSIRLWFFAFRINW